ncbi:MAG: sigma-70 family RNA polymerase sigma factor [Kofleriaceae bacterium]
MLPREDFDRWVADHRAALHARAVQLCRGTGDADDVLQDALLRAFQARGQLRDPAHARGWLLSIVTSTFLDSLRRKKARPQQVELQVDVPAPAVERLAPWMTLSLDDVREAASELPDDVRDTYRMFALERRDYNTIAKDLGIAKATVGTRILRARKLLRALLIARLEARR